KIKRRQRIARVMLTRSRNIEDHSGVVFWTHVQQSLKILTYQGMSDEESGYDEDEGVPIKYVLDFPHRHHDFKLLFQYIDNIPSLHPGFFRNTGTKRLKRVPVNISTARLPRLALPSSFMRYDHLACSTEKDDSDVAGPTELVLILY
ncbi:hypothetical protein F5879DRAFT_798988, partial [Lentinula edodes]